GGRVPRAGLFFPHLRGLLLSELETELLPPPSQRRVIAKLGNQNARHGNPGEKRVRGRRVAGKHCPGPRRQAPERAYHLARVALGLTQVVFRKRRPWIDDVLEQVLENRRVHLRK